MLSKKTIITFILVLQIIVIKATESFRVVIDGYKAQTGFKIKNKIGILTALHGVAGYHKITIYNSETKTDYDDNVQITYIDYDNDVCLLQSVSINQINGNYGYDVSSNINESILKGKSISVVGYPEGLTSNRSIPLQVEPIHPYIKLEELISNPSSAKKLRIRASPKMDANVLNINGNLLPGHSGAPILYNNEVIGIADGGLDYGRIGIGFAIIFNEINLEKFSFSQKYNLLANNSSYLFVYEYSTSEPGVESVCSIFKEIDQECTVDFKNIIGSKIDESTYSSKANFLNALHTDIDMDAEMGDVKVGTIDLYLYSTSKNDSWKDKPTKIDKSSDEYDVLIDEFQLTRKLLIDCFKSITTEKKSIDHDTRLSEGLTMGPHVEIYLNNNTYISLYIIGNRLMLSFYSHTDLQDAID